MLFDHLAASLFLQIILTTMEKHQLLGDAFEIRSEKSYSNLDKSRCYSLDSEEAPAHELSLLIDEIIGEEKERYAPSRTENRFQQNLSLAVRRRNITLGRMSSMKPSMNIPKSISRILESPKIYPEVPVIRDSPSQDAIYGAFFGFLIGDIVGSQVAYVTRNISQFVPNALLMNGGGTYNLGAGQGTDQTEIMLCLCYGLLKGEGRHNRDIISQQYLDWFESKPFSFSAVVALSLRELHIRKLNGESFRTEQLGQILLQSSLKNKNQQSSIGLIRILPLVLFGLKFDEPRFEKLIRDELSLICPNGLVIESGLVYAKILKTVITTRDHELAFYEASKWVYANGSSKLLELWGVIEKGVEIKSSGNMGRLKTSFTYACIEINRGQPDFMESLVKVMLRGGDTETNCAVVMGIVGAIVGYNRIPNYLKQKIVNSRMKNSPRPRDEKYSPHNIVEIIEKLSEMDKNSR